MDKFSNLLCLRNCDSCLEEGQKRLRRAIVAFTTDPEEGSKKAMLSL